MLSKNALHLRIDTHLLSPMPQLHRIGPKPSGQMPSSGSVSRTHNLVHLEVSFQEYTYTNKHSPQQHPIPGPMLPNTTEEDISSTIDVTFLSHRRKGTPFGSFEDKVIIMSSKPSLCRCRSSAPPIPNMSNARV